MAIVVATSLYALIFWDVYKVRILFMCYFSGHASQPHPLLATHALDGAGVK